MLSPTQIRGLPVRQPWAWGICAGIKRTANRKWSTDFRGTIAIHASTTPQMVNALRESSGCELVTCERFEFGAIIGLADITAVAPYGPQHETDPFAEGPYCWTLANARFLRMPIPLRGKGKLFRIAPAIQQQLRAAETFTLDPINDPEAAAIAKAITAEPDPFRRYEELFIEYMYNHKQRQAVAFASERLVELAPERAKSYMVRAWSKLTSGDALGAITDGLRCVELDPDMMMGWGILARAHLRLNQYPKACEAAGRMVKDLEAPYTGPSRGDLNFALKRYAKRWEAILADCERWVEMDPQDVLSRKARAEVRAALGDRAGALEDLAEAERLAPGDPSIAKARIKLIPSG